MATKKRAKKTAKKRATKKGSHFATLSKKVPKDHLAFVVGNEVRITKRKNTRKKARK